MVSGPAGILALLDLKRRMNVNNDSIFIRNDSTSCCRSSCTRAYIHLTRNLPNNWKQWKQVWSAYEIVTRFSDINEQTDEYRKDVFITCIGPKALAIHNGFSFRFVLAKILE